MVVRNPGLLAATGRRIGSQRSTMVFSYLVGYTRPFGSVLLLLLFLALLSLAIEAPHRHPFGLPLLFVSVKHNQ